MKLKYSLRIIGAFLSMMCLINLQLHAQSLTDYVGEPLGRDYIYYPTEESNSPGASRFGVVLGTSVVAGVLIGAVAVSIASHHHRGSQSANYTAFSHEVSENIYSEMYSTDVYDSLDNVHHIHSSGSSGSSGSHGSYESSKSSICSNDNRDETKFTVVEKFAISPVNEDQKLCFNYEIEAIKGEDEVTPYVESSSGVILGQSQYVSGPVHFPPIVVKNPSIGVYRAGFATKRLTDAQLSTVVRVINSDNEQIVLDESGLYKVD